MTRNNTNTKWFDMPGYKGLYQLSADGMVRSVRTGETITVERPGTPAARVRLHREGNRTAVPLTRLVEVATNLAEGQVVRKLNVVNSRKTNVRTKSQQKTVRSSQVRARKSA